MRKILLASLALSFAVTAYADTVYQAPQAFLQETFGADVPAASVLNVGDIKQELEGLLERPYHAQRIRYWEQGNRSAWILDEVGKERPITIGVIIENRRITRLQVLVFRESRGWEVSSADFLFQFKGAGLNPDRRLDRRVDGISGATLSVRALDRAARLALLLNDKKSHGSPAKP